MSDFKFRRPFFICPHAVTRFKERVVDIPAAEVITIVQAALQIQRKPAWAFKMRNGKIAKTYSAKYGGVLYYIPVVKQEGDNWPIVPTILNSKMGEKSEEERKLWKTGNTI